MSCCSQSAQDLIGAFEEEQKSVVFSALSDYLHLSLFADVALVCGSASSSGPCGPAPVRRRLWAHRVVLASSSKFFRDLFRQDPGNLRIMTPKVQLNGKKAYCRLFFCWALYWISRFQPHSRIFISFLPLAGLQEVDLDKELAPNDLVLAFEDIQLITGILYCVGTVEISPPRIKSLLVASQVLGIPTLTRFLKKIDCSLSPGAAQPSSSTSAVTSKSLFRGTAPVHSPSFLSPAASFQRPRDKTLSSAGYAAFPGPVAVPHAVPAAVSIASLLQGDLCQGSQEVGSSGGSGFLVSCAGTAGKQELLSRAASPISRPSAPKPGGVPSATFRQSFEHRPTQSPPSRSHSRNTLVSIGSFSLQPLPSPLIREPAIAVTGAATTAASAPGRTPPPHPSRVVSSVLESFDPSFLNSLPANQIDDLENALLPHLNQQEDHAAGTSHQPETTPGPLIQQRNADGERPKQRSEPEADSDRAVAPELHGPATSTQTDCLKGREGTENSSLAPIAFTPSRILPPLAGIRPASKEEIARSKRLDAEAAARKDSAPSSTSSREFRRLLPEGKQDLTASAMVLTPQAKSAVDATAQEVNRPGEDGDAASDHGGCSTLGSPDACGEREYNDGLVINDSREAQDTSRGSEREKEHGGERKEEEERRRTEEEKEEGTEISVNLDAVKEGKSFKFAIPGSSKYVSLNFSADALLEMKNSVKKSGRSGGGGSSGNGDVQQEVSSSTTATEATVVSSEIGEEEKAPLNDPSPKTRRKKGRVGGPRKGKFACPHCVKVYPSRAMLERHQAFHMAASVACGECGEVFKKRWQLDEHAALRHGRGEPPLRCQECGREFRFRRNLLAHLQLHHQVEKRHRCKFCPLTFLQRKSYIKHQTTKHPKQPPTWCRVRRQMLEELNSLRPSLVFFLLQFCLEIFESGKQREDHSCARVERDGARFICRMHGEGQFRTFAHQAELDAHLKEEHGDDGSAMAMLKSSCPVCHKVSTLA